jgi:hypothetical protein
MKFSCCSLLVAVPLLSLSASSYVAAADSHVRSLRNSRKTEATAADPELLLVEPSTSESVGSMDAENRVGRKLADFMDQAQDEVEETEIDSLEQNADPTKVEIVDSEADEVKEDAEMESDAEIVKEEFEDENPSVDTVNQVKNRRKFVRYEPSAWESQWVDQIDDIMQSQSLCRSLLASDVQRNKVHDYLKSICGTHPADQSQWNWCYYEDATHFMWYNLDNRDKFEIYVNEMPPGIDERPHYVPAYPQGDIAASVISKLVYFDEFTGEEYSEAIEPLVSHLRFPLAGCLKNLPLLGELTTFVLGPGYLDRTNARKMIYDVGSPDWSRLAYIVKDWGIFETEFQEISSYATSPTVESNDEFPKTVPADQAGRIFREYFELTDAPTDDPSKLFLPDKIMDQVDVNDYILLKLDHGNARFKENLIQYIIDSDNVHIDELMWEVNNSDNYVLKKYIEDHATFEDMSSMKLGDAYRMLQALRNKGIRAHAWN